MGLFFDAEGNPVERDEATATQEYLAGRLALPQRERHNVRGADGRVISVADSEVDSVLAQRDAEGRPMFSLASEADAAAQLRRQEAENQALRTGAENVASGLTFGLSDVLAEAGVAAVSGDQAAREFVEGRRLRDEVNPGSAMGGQALGAVLPALATGGGSIAGSGAGAVARGGARGALRYSPAGIVMRAAESAGARTTEALAARGAGRVLARGAGMAVEGGIEGAIAGGAQVLTEAALEDRELTAETLLAGAGMGGLLGFGLGGALGGGVGGVEAGVAAAGRSMRNASNRLGAQTQRLLGAGERIGQQTVDAVQSVYRRSAGPDAPDLNRGVAELWARGSSLATGADEATLRRFSDLSPAGQEARRLITNADQVIEGASREGREILDELHKLDDIVLDDAFNWKPEHVRARVERSVQPGARDAATAEVDDLLSRMYAQTEEMTSQSAQWGQQPAVRRFQRDIELIHEQLAAARRNNDPDALTDYFLALDGLKRRLGKQARFGEDLKQLSNVDQTSVQRLQAWHEELRQHLENQSIYGDAAVMQREMNAPVSRMIGSSGSYRQIYTKKTGEIGGRAIRTHDPAALESRLRNLGRVRNDLSEEALHTHLADRRATIKALEELGDLSPAAQQAVQEAKIVTKRLEEWLGRTTEQVGTINQFRAIADASKDSAGLLGAGIGGTLGAIAGAAVGMPGIGAAAGSAVGSLLVRPDAAIKTLAALERMNRAMDGRIGKAVRGFLGAGQGTAAGAVRKAAGTAVERAKEVGQAGARMARRAGQMAQRGAQAAGRAGVEAGRAGRRGAVAYALSTYDERAKAVRAAQGDAQGMADRIAAATAPIQQAAPQTAAHMAMQATRAVNFLAARLPQARPDMLQPIARPGRVSEQARAKWLRYARAVDDPISVVEDLEAGDLYREGAEVLRELYPRLYQRVQTTIMEQLAAMEEPLPYAQRMQLGILFQIPADRSLEPGMVQTLQMTWAAPTPDQAPPTSAPMQPGRAPDIASAAPLASDMDVFERRQAASG